MQPPKSPNTTSGSALNAVQALSQTPSHGYFGWRVVLAAAAGLTVGNAPILVFTFGLFLTPLATEFGWTRGQISLALMIHVVFVGLSTPFIGRLMDRLGTRRVLFPAIVFAGAGAACLSLLGPSLPILYIAFAILGCLYAALTPPPYARVVCAWFDRRRGLALGISSAGIGLGAAVMPPIAQYLIAAFGWRTAYVALGVFTIASIPLLFAFLRDPLPGEFDDLDSKKSAASISAGASGDTLAQAIRKTQFWILFAGFLLSAGAVTAASVHMVPLLTDAGLQPQQAAAIAAALGLALIAGRVVSGHLMDRIFAPYVAMSFFVIAGTGMLVLAGPTGIAAGLLGAVLVGLGIGAEVDVLAYLASRYFGLRNFTEIAAWQFIAYIAGTSIGPAIMGVTFDRVGSYRPALLCFAAIMVICVILFSRLGPYRTSTETLAEAGAR